MGRARRAKIWRRTHAAKAAVLVRVPYLRAVVRVFTRFRVGDLSDLRKV